MSKLPAILVLAVAFITVSDARAQVMKSAEILSPGAFALSGSPTVYMDDGANEIAMFVYALYGLGRNTNLRFSAGFFEDENYIGGNFEWNIQRRTPMTTFSIGGHYVTDPAADATLNLTFPLNRNFALHTGVDADLIFDDDPDLPLWAFLGFSYKLLNRVDIVAEFNYGFVEIAPHVLASGFVFYF